MGVVAEMPVETAEFYSDAYYQSRQASAHGYIDYEFTAAHSLLWAILLVEALARSGGAILDIGCATGSLLSRLKGAWRRYGIEVNASAAAAASDRGIEIIGQDVLAPGLPDSYAQAFDVITAIATFEHVRDIRAAVAASLAMLRPSGVLIFEVPVISATRDNSDWLNGSYEHIFYPTIQSIKTLFAAFPDVRLHGFETEIAGFSSTYIGVVTRDPARFSEVERLLGVMRSEDPQDLPQDEAVLNLAYNVVHNFRPTPARILRLPELLERHFTPHLGTRLMQLWHKDSVLAAADRHQAADWHQAQARNWREAAEALLRQTMPEHSKTIQHCD
jgi:SAM-dependent methyltransferase